jgi:hypothetical protein
MSVLRWSKRLGITATTSAAILGTLGSINGGIIVGERFDGALADPARRLLACFATLCRGIARLRTYLHQRL